MSRQEIEALSNAEKILLVEQLWDSINKEAMNSNLRINKNWISALKSMSVAKPNTVHGKTSSSVCIIPSPFSLIETKGRVMLSGVEAGPGFFLLCPFCLTKKNEPRRSMAHEHL